MNRPGSVGGIDRLRDRGSTLLTGDLAQRMVIRRPNTRLVEFPDAGHWIHDDDPDGFANVISAFLNAPALRTKSS